MGAFFKQYGSFLSLIILCVIVALPTPEGLTIAGHRMLGLLVFSVILCMTECTSYPVSAAIIITLMVLLLGFAPDVVQPDKMIGTSKALTMSLGGFSNTAWALVGAALVISIATATF